MARAAKEGAKLVASVALKPVSKVAAKGATVVRRRAAKAAHGIGEALDDTVARGTSCRLVPGPLALRGRHYIAVQDKMDETVVESVIPKTYKQSGHSVPMVLATSNPGRNPIGGRVTQIAAGSGVLESEYSLPPQLIFDITKSPGKLADELEKWRPECLVLNAHASPNGLLGNFTSWMPSFHVAPTKLLQVNACGSARFIKEVLSQPSQWLVVVLWESSVDSLACISWTDGFWRSFLQGSDLRTAIARGAAAIPTDVDIELDGARGPAVWSRGGVGVNETWDSMMAHLPTGPAVQIHALVAPKAAPARRPARKAAVAFDGDFPFPPSTLPYRGA